MKKLTILLAVLTAATSCKKNITPSTEPVYFTSTTYQTLGTYDTTGKPGYLENNRDVISSNLQTFMSNTLPEHADLAKSHPEFFSSSAIGDIAVTEKSTVYLTYVSNGAALPNAFAFYTYQTNNPPKNPNDIKSITYAFPNVGFACPLKPGDKVKIGTFEPGISIGFVLMQSSWNSISKQLDNNAVHFCSNDVLNPETDPSKKRHAVIINYAPENKFLIGFEDLNRTDPYCDNDFNDVILYATITH